MNLHSNGWNKIDCIKLFRALTQSGLVEAKYAVEAFLNTFGIEYIDDFRGATLFIAFSTAFSSGKVKMDKENNVVWNKSPVLTYNDIRILCEGG